jgi:hypothetical protein
MRGNIGSALEAVNLAPNRKEFWSLISRYNKDMIVLAVAMDQTHCHSFTTIFC